MTYPVYIALGILPSFIWLAYYLRKDTHPESTPMILKIFLWGMLIALPAVFIELGVLETFKQLKIPELATVFLNVFIGVALVEEMLKYLIIREKVLNHHEFDEPTDAAIYMIIAALGFAAIENILILFQLGPTFLFGKALEISIFRFWGATLLHALASGLIGYFLALSIMAKQNKSKMLIFGLTVGVLLHGLYNFSIMKINNGYKFLLPLIIIAGLSIFIYFGFKKLRKLESVCKI